MSTLENKIGDFLFDTSCELGLKGNDLLQQCMNILQQKLTKMKTSEGSFSSIPSHSLSIEIPSYSSCATPGNRSAFSPCPSSAFTSRSPALRAASKESCFAVQDKDDENDPLDVSMDSEDVNLIDGLSDATVCSNLTNEIAEQTVAADNTIVVNQEKPKRKRAPRQVDPLKAAMKAKKEELSKEKQAQKDAKAAEKEKSKKAKEVTAATEEAGGSAKRKPKRKAAEQSNSASASASENAEPEKKKKRTRKPLEVQATKALVIDDDDMFGDQEEEEQVENTEVDNNDEGFAETEIDGFVDEGDEDEDEEDGVSIDGGEVDDIWQKKVIDGKSYTISSMTNKVYNSSLFVVGERYKETGDIRFYSTSPQPSTFELKA